jgi:hypothetical protein
MATELRSESWNHGCSQCLNGKLYRSKSETQALVERGGNDSQSRARGNQQME